MCNESNQSRGTELVVKGSIISDSWGKQQLSTCGQQVALHANRAPSTRSLCCCRGERREICVCRRELERRKAAFSLRASESAFFSLSFSDAAPLSVCLWRFLRPAQLHIGEWGCRIVFPTQLIISPSCIFLSTYMRCGCRDVMHVILLHLVILPSFSFLPLFLSLVFIFIILIFLVLFLVHSFSLSSHASASLSRGHFSVFLLPCST